MTTSVESLDISALPQYQKRCFVPQDFDFYSPTALVALYEKLRDRAIESSDQLEQWVLDRSEVEAAFDQAGSVLYIRDRKSVV